MKQKVLFVCLGNICRSPMAEEIFRQKVFGRGLGEQFEIDSAGTYSGHAGELADPRMRDYFTTYADRYDYVPDPYYEGREGFYLVIDMLEEACEKLLDELVQ